MDFKILLRTTARYTNILASNGITNLKELMLYFPRTYEDRQEIKRLSQLTTDGTLQTVKGYITKKSMFTTPTGKKISQIHFIDEDEQA
jgi:ATP-dependent DNA helicase RecG